MNLLLCNLNYTSLYNSAGYKKQIAVVQFSYMRVKIASIVATLNSLVFMGCVCLRLSFRRLLSCVFSRALEAGARSPLLRNGLV
jgi:hypothetical protein